MYFTENKCKEQDSTSGGHNSPKRSKIFSINRYIQLADYIVERRKKTDKRAHNETSNESLMREYFAILCKLIY